MSTENFTQSAKLKGLNFKISPKSDSKITAMNWFTAVFFQEIIVKCTEEKKHPYITQCRDLDQFLTVVFILHYFLIIITLSDARTSLSNKDPV